MYVWWATALYPCMSIHTHAYKQTTQALRAKGLERVTERVARLPIAPEYKVCRSLRMSILYLYRPDPSEPPPTKKKKNKMPSQVMRVWFDQQLSGKNGTIDILETPDFAPVNLIAQYHLLEEECMAWANKTGGTCLCVFICVATVDGSTPSCTTRTHTYKHKHTTTLIYTHKRTYMCLTQGRSSSSTSTRGRTATRPTTRHVYLYFIYCIIISTCVYCVCDRLLSLVQKGRIETVAPHPNRKHNPSQTQVWEVIKPTICGQIYPEICDKDFKILGT